MGKTISQAEEPGLSKLKKRSSTLASIHYPLFLDWIDAPSCLRDVFVPWLPRRDRL